MGPPGLGKTTVARRLGRFFRSLGMLGREEPVIHTASTMQTGFLGQAALRAREILREARGGVLLIDEAYELMSDAFGRQIQSELVAALTEEEFQGKICVVLAGYEDKMCASLGRSRCSPRASPLNRGTRTPNFRRFLFRLCPFPLVRPCRDDMLKRGNAGIRSRFQMRLRMRGYTPAEYAAMVRDRLATLDSVNPVVLDDDAASGAAGAAGLLGLLSPIRSAPLGCPSRRAMYISPLAAHALHATGC